MNKRQYKKMYKKEHGDNLPINTVRSWGRTVGKATKVIADALQNIIKTGIKAMKQFEEHLKNMPAEEFEEKIKALTPEQRQLVYKLRGEIGE